MEKVTKKVRKVTQVETGVEFLFVFGLQGIRCDRCLSLAQVPSSNGGGSGFLMLALHSFGEGTRPGAADPKATLVGGLGMK